MARLYAEAVRPLVMGVLNVTPDSFSDGGLWFEPDAAVAHGRSLAAQGADIVDVGGESTRPGAEPVDPREEQRRVLPVVAALAPHVRVSVDTRHADTAAAALAEGATLLNDVSASLFEVAADAGAGWVAMHMAGEPRTMQHDPTYTDVVAEVRAVLVERAERAVAAGVDEVWIDPGFGFGKTVGHNLALLADLEALTSTGFPVCVGLSRKGFVGKLLAASDEAAASPQLPGLGADPDLDAVRPVAVGDRLDGSLATAVWAVEQGAGMVRVHDVAATVAALSLVAP